MIRRVWRHFSPDSTVMNQTRSPSGDTGSLGAAVLGLC